MRPLDDFVALHQWIEIICVVDGYEARLYQEPGYVHCIGQADTIAGALEALQTDCNAKWPEGIA